jgi:hypothetical protein
MNSFNVRLFVAGIACVPVGFLLLAMALGEDPILPHGIWQGPLVSVLGVVLLILAFRAIKADEE